MPLIRDREGLSMRVCVSEREREGCRERIKAGKRKIVRKMEQVNGLKVRERE